MKTINKWITAVFVCIGLDILLSLFAPIGTSRVVDAIQIVIQLALLVCGSVVLLRIINRKDMIFENETIRNLIYYKEHTKRMKNYPISSVIFVIFVMFMLAMTTYQGAAFYYFYMMQ